MEVVWGDVGCRVVLLISKSEHRVDMTCVSIGEVGMVTVAGLRRSVSEERKEFG